MNEKISSPFDRAVRVLGVTGGVLALISIVSGIIMLLLEWAQESAPYFLTWLAMFLLPVAFIMLFVALLLLLLRRRNS